MRLTATIEIKRQLKPRRLEGDEKVERELKLEMPRSLGGQREIRRLRERVREKKQLVFWKRMKGEKNQ